MTEESAQKPARVAPPESSVERLLSRMPPVGYLREWETDLAREKNNPKALPHHAVAIFRLGPEYLALSSIVIGQITTMRPLHRVPHIRGDVIQGVVNLNGRLRMFISLENLLGIGREWADQGGTQSRDIIPMIVIQHQGDVWAFAATEALGVFHIDLSEARNAPVTILKSNVNYVKGVISWRDKQVGLLDEELLLFSLHKSII